MNESVKPQVWAAYVAIGALILAAAALVGGKFGWALTFAVLTVGGWAVARALNRKSPVPMPYALRWFMFVPRGQSPGSLAKVLDPKPGERILEVGPGPGVHALPVAAALLPGGVLETLDVQPEMLDFLRRRAEKAGVTNIVTQRGDAQALPYPSGAFDAAYMIGTLGEIPDGDAALRELRRVLKTNGRLVIGEAFIDPDFIPLSALVEKAKAAGFSLERASNPRLCYFALLRPIGVGVQPF